MPFLGKQPTTGFSSIAKDDFTADGSTTAFTLSRPAASANDVAVFVGNVRQEPTDAYSVSGTTLTLTAAPASGLNFYALHLGTVESTTVPAAGTTVPGSFGVDGDLTVDTTTLVVDSTNNRVGIGTSSPSTTLDIQAPSTVGGIKLRGRSGANDEMKMSFSNTTGGTELANIYCDSNNFLSVGTVSSLPFAFKTSNTERMRLDSSGNLLVGKTSADLTTAGVELSDLGSIKATRDGISGFFNRNTTDGTVIQLRKNNTTIGGLGVSSGRVFIGDGSFGGLSFSNGVSTVFPSDSSGDPSDNTHNLGISTNRFKDLYLSGGVYLGGTGSANYLDDYEEGTFTPTFINVDAPTYTTQNGRYTKIGNVVYFEIEVVYSSLNTADVSALGFKGLPFNVDDSYRSSAHLVPNTDGYAGSGADNVTFAMVNPDTAIAYGAGSNPNEFDYSSGNWNASGTIALSGWYITAS